jgi:hypothetical protein
MNTLVESLWHKATSALRTMEKCKKRLDNLSPDGHFLHRRIVENQYVRAVVEYTKANNAYCDACDEVNPAQKD